jgi:hypothetical protein
MSRHWIELRPGLGWAAYDIERDIKGLAHEADVSFETRLGMAYFEFVIYRAWGDAGPRSYSPDFRRGTSIDDPRFGDGWVVSLNPYNDRTAAALGPHIMFLADQHLGEDREGHLAAIAGAMNAYARKFTVLA